MNVSEALELPSFAQSHVVAGNTGMENEISTAMVLEATDIENWGRKGQLIITSFFALQTLSDAEVVHFFRTMSAMGIGAIAFKPERLLPQAPAHIIELCNDLDLPLIEIAPDIKYEAILLDVLGHVLDSNLTLLQRFYDTHRHMMALALKQPSIPYILSTLKNTLHAEVSYLDASSDRRLSTDPNRAAFTAYSLMRRDPSPYQTHAYFDAVLYYQHETQAFAVRIPSTDGVDHFLIVHQPADGLTPLHTMTIENIVSLLQMEILKQNAIKQKVFFQNNSVVHDVLLGRFGTEERLSSALSTLGIDEYPLYEVMLVRTNLIDPSDIDRLGELQQAIRNKIKQTWPSTAYFINNDRIVFLHNLRSERTRIDLALVEHGLDELHASATLPLFNHLITLSGLHDQTSIHKANDEVLSTYRLFEGSEAANHAIRFDDMGIYKLLMSADDPAQLTAYTDPRVQRLAQEHPELFETLVVLCECGMDYPRCAHQLFIHPKTVRYRSERAKKLYDIDVRRPDDFLQVIITSKIRALGRDR